MNFETHKPISEVHDALTEAGYKMVKLRTEKSDRTTSGQVAVIEYRNSPFTINVSTGAHGAATYSLHSISVSSENPPRYEELLAKLR